MSLLHDVHRLARIYHWSQCDILTMSLRRRLAYLELIDADETAALIADLRSEG